MYYIVKQPLNSTTAESLEAFLLTSLVAAVSFLETRGIYNGRACKGAIHIHGAVAECLQFFHGGSLYPNSTTFSFFKSWI
mmetsp:Transcript_7847/g.11291  ORF Transcript_7847/g.11291 Transcript_7847/m.11291 type:complete len:80 (+) Transcript_7847:94-333(+)